MKPTNPFTLTSTLTLALLATLLAGCTHTYHPPKEPFTGYTPQPKIPLTVALNITDELRQAKWERKSMGDTWVIPIGESVPQNAAVLARHVFAAVIETSNGATPTGPVDAILTPKVAYINRTQGATSFGESIVSLKLEWTLTDAAGKTIWLDTITGESSGSTGWTNPKKVLKAALEDVLTKSQQAISSSESIRQFATKK